METAPEDGEYAVSISGFSGIEAQIQSMPRYNRVPPPMTGIADALRYTVPEPRRWFTITAPGAPQTPEVTEWLDEAGRAVQLELERRIIEREVNPPVVFATPQAGWFAIDYADMEARSFLTGSNLPIHIEIPRIDEEKDEE